MNATGNDAPLTQWTIIGFDERWNCPAPDVKMPGGTCWHCHTAIAYCVIIRNKQTHAVETIGRICAERVGMNKEQLKQHMSHYYRDRADKAYAIAEAEQAAEHGEHGTAQRFESGCECRRCRAAAPHGTSTRFQTGCRCTECIDAIIAFDPDSYWIDEEYPVIVELATGRVARAEVVDAQYGSQWKVRASNGATVYLARFPKRRTTHSKKGFVEATTTALVIGGRGWHRLEYPITEPTTDIWGEPIPHPA